jgi:hypothetical protein
MVGTLAVPDYRCYLLGLSGSILVAHDISCEDDQAAIAKAYEIYQPRDFEIWRRDKRVYPAAALAHRPDGRNLEQARRWRLKAEECRTISEQMQTPMAKTSFRQMAETYDSLADGAEERATGLPPVKRPETG